jgi:isopenicillin-N N-acyltransferase-like protein
MATLRYSTFPVLRVHGGPGHRGRAYGAQAKAQIRRSIASYEQVFRHYAGWDWPTVREHAARFADAIADFSPGSAREIAAIAAGAGVEAADILALNTRSEIMFAGRRPTGDHLGGHRPSALGHLAGECTSFALAAERTATARIAIGQNWDWLEHARQTAIVLEVRRDDGPDFITVVEAGLLAKVGLNSSGVGLCTNTLISDGDEGRVAVPYHVLLRSVLDSESGQAAAAQIQRVQRANSANFLIVDDSGFCVDLEAAPFDNGVSELAAANGLVAHSNHFISDGLTGEDRYLQRKPHSADRLRNITKSLGKRQRLTSMDVRAALADHRDSPDSVCQHPDPAMPAEERTCTVAAVVMDVGERRLEFTSGNPCETSWTAVTL